jgi:hypothetical protein
MDIHTKFPTTFYDSFLTDDEHKYLVNYSDKIYSYLTSYQKEQALIISSTEEWSTDYVTKDLKLENIFEKFVKTLEAFLPQVKMESVEHWFIYSSLSHKEPISVTHGAHFDDNKWSIKENHTVEAPSLIAIYYLYETPTAIRVFNIDYKMKSIVSRIPEQLIQFEEIACKENRLIVFPGDKYHGVVGTLKEEGVCKRTGLVFNLWKDSPQRPWWI